MSKKEKIQETYADFRAKVLDLVDRSIHFFEVRIVDDNLLPSKIKNECFFQLIGKFDNFEDLNREVGCVSNFVDVFLSGVEYSIKRFNLPTTFRWNCKKDTI